MKKLMFAMCLAGALCAFSAEEAKAPKAEGGAPAKREMRQRPQRQPMTEEQIKERREKFMAMIKERQAAQQQKVVDALKEAGLDEAKAKATAEKIQKIYMEGRMGPGGRSMGPGGRGMGPGPRGPRGPRPEPKKQ